MVTWMIAIDCLIDWFIDWLLDWLIDWLTTRLIDWLIDWVSFLVSPLVPSRLCFQVALIKPKISSAGSAIPARRISTPLTTTSTVWPSFPAGKSSVVNAPNRSAKCLPNRNAAKTLRKSQRKWRQTTNWSRFWWRNAPRTRHPGSSSFARCYGGPRWECCGSRWLSASDSSRPFSLLCYWVWFICSRRTPRREPWILMAPFSSF